MIDDKYAQTEIRVPLPPRPARHLPVRQPTIRYRAASAPVPHIEAVVVREQMDPTFIPPSGSLNPAATVLQHPVDVRRPRHARPEDVVTQPSWWRRERTHLYAGVAGGGLVLFVAALVYVSWAVLG